MISLPGQVRRDINDILAKQGDGSAPQPISKELRDSLSISTAEKSLRRLEDEATLLLAGTESPTKSLGIAHYYLVKTSLHPGKATASIDQEPNLDKNEYLYAVVQEANRLSFGLTGRQPRVSPDEFVTYTDAEKGKCTDFRLGRRSARRRC